jgi:hypothetical protein
MRERLRLAGAARVSRTGFQMSGLIARRAKMSQQATADFQKQT